jgi:hypothetical protein
MGKALAVVEVSIAKKDSVLPEAILTGEQDSVDPKDYVGIKGAKAELGVGYTQYVRRLLLEGKLEGVKLDHGHYRKWHIYRPSIDRYMEEHRRTEQARRFILRAELEDREKIEAALDEAGIDYSLELAYKGKE